MAQEIADIDGLQSALAFPAGFVPCADRCVFPYQQSAGVASGRTGRSRHTLTADVIGLMLAYSNVQAGVGEVDATYSHLLHVGVEDGATPDFIKVGCRGTRDWNFLSGSIHWSDPFGYTGAAGTELVVRTFCDADAAETFCNGYATNAADNTGVTNGFDTAWAGGVSNNTTAIIAPCAIVGVTRRAVAEAVALTGDSNMLGSGNSTTRNASFGSMACAARSLPWFNLARSAQVSANYVGFARRNRAMLDQKCPFGMVLYGTNDVTNGVAANAIFANLLEIGRFKRNAGQRALICTLPPNCTSTDSFATLANQTVQANEAQRVALNALIRSTNWAFSNDYPYIGVADIAAMVESPSAAGKWNVDGTAFKFTANGTHLSYFGHTQAALACNTERFQF